jgi:acetyl/propionyl-CoA carboxylase alpha subunit
VKEQIRIAEGHPLSFTAADVRQCGHAIECRICAEDPSAGFAPALGRIEALSLPGGPGIRVDSTLSLGMEVTRYYDSMLAKLCAFGPDRDTAIARMLQALSELKVAGVRTNIAFLSRLIRTPAVRAGDYSTALVGEVLDTPPTVDRREDLAIVAGVILEHLERGRPRARAVTGSASDAWKLSGRPTS